MMNNWFEIIKKIDVLAPEGAYYHQFTLTTEMRLDRMPQPCDFQFFRTHCASRWLYEGEWLTYPELLEPHLRDGKHFPGTSHFEEAINIERWKEDRYEGWEHYGNYQVRWLGEGSWYSARQRFTGSQLMDNLNDCIYDWERENASGE